MRDLNFKREPTSAEIADKAKSLIKQLSKLINESDYSVEIVYIALNKMQLELEEKFGTRDTMKALKHIKDFASQGLLTTEEVQ